jgi:hypothetical protein
LSFLVFQLHHHGGHSLHGWLHSTLSLRIGCRGRGHFPPRVGRSRRVGGRTDATIVVAATHATQRQCLAGTVVTPAAATTTEATLVATHQLLHNPSPPHTSPSVAEQWRHDIDQLVIVAINTPPHGGQR